MKLLVMVALVYGYVLNILDLINKGVFDSSIETILSIGGVFMPPAGIFMGYYIHYESIVQWVTQAIL